jgi:pre-mRNA-processing factor 6
VGNNQIASSAQVGDITKARLLCQKCERCQSQYRYMDASVWVEEAAGKLLEARKLIQEGCDVCLMMEENVWLEAARSHPPNVAKSILATAVRRIPTSVKLFLKAANLEHHNEAAQKGVAKSIGSQSDENHAMEGRD